jgi:hypothetical protein
MRQMALRDAAYQRGYVDALLGRSYADGKSPRHHYTIFVPGCKFCSSDQVEYREGWLAGKASLLF